MSVTLSADQLTECVEINIVDDADLDPDEEFTLVLSTTTGATVRPSVGTAQVNITDNEQGKLMNASFLLINCTQTSRQYIITSTCDVRV